MKPDWKNAPEWANYLAQDEDSRWWWFSSKPKEGDTNWYESEGKSYMASTSKNWTESLEQRP